MKKFLVVVFAAMLLVGCSGKERKVICTNTIDEDIYVTEFNAKGDNIISDRTDIEVLLESWDITESDLTDEKIEKIKAYLDDAYLGDYYGLKGVTTESKILDDKKTYTATIIIDYENVDMDELESIGVIESGSFGNTDISLESTLEDYKGCEEQEL